MTEPPWPATVAVYDNGGCSSATTSCAHRSRMATRDADASTVELVDAKHAASHVTLTSPGPLLTTAKAHELSCRGRPQMLVHWRGDGGGAAVRHIGGDVDCRLCRRPVAVYVHF